MLELTTLADAPLLIPNPSHKNFTQTDEYIPKGTKVKGEIKTIKGLRRGQPFNYKLFLTDNKFIHLNKVQPNMKDVEVTLGADGIQDQTTVSIPQKKALNLDAITIGTMLVIAGGAYWYGNSKKYSMKHKLIISGLAAVAGYFAGQGVNKIIGKNKITVLKTK